MRNLQEDGQYNTIAELVKGSEAVTKVSASPLVWAFVWRITPEKYPYWNDINNQFEQLLKTKQL